MNVLRPARLSISKYRVSTSSKFSFEHKFKFVVATPRSSFFHQLHKSVVAAQLPSNGLRLLQNIDGRSLAVADDNKAVDAWGLCARGRDLILSDNDNRAVKKLGGFVGDPFQLEVSILFRESSGWLLPDWHVSNAREVLDANGLLLVVTEGTRGGNRRVYLARQNGGTFAVSQNFDLDPSYVLIFSIHYFLCLTLLFV